MKFSATVIALVSVAAQAAAIERAAYPNAVFSKGVGHAGHPAQAGYIDKRAAETITEAEPKKRGKIYSCGVPGNPCVKPRDAELVAEAMANAEAEPEAEPKKGGKVYSCGAPGNPCVKPRDEELNTPPLA